MIKLHRGEKPVQLTEELEIELTEKYKTTKESVWKKQFIKDSLLELSNNKCCYCETKLGVESKYLHIEHFHPKDTYEDEVVLWENLLPSCERCNKSKGKHDTKLEPIIDPTLNTPNDSLILKNYRFIAKNELGQTTIDILNLNDTKKIVQPRFLIGEAISKKIDEMLEHLKIPEYLSTSRRRNGTYRKIYDILEEGSPTSEYSAVVATVLLEYDNYKKLKHTLKEASIWDEDLEMLESEVKRLKFDTSLTASKQVYTKYESLA